MPSRVGRPHVIDEIQSFSMSFACFFFFFFVSRLFVNPLDSWTLCFILGDYPSIRVFSLSLLCCCIQSPIGRSMISSRPDRSTPAQHPGLLYNSSSMTTMSTSTPLEPLRGSCSCGRNQYLIRIPDDVTDHAEVYFDDSSDNRTSISIFHLHTS